jgi:hypothetical protein
MVPRSRFVSAKRRQVSPGCLAGVGLLALALSLGLNLLVILQHYYTDFVAFHVGAKLDETLGFAGRTNGDFNSVRVPRFRSGAA